MSSKGQIVLPAEIREKYGISKGSQLEIVEWAGQRGRVRVALPASDPSSFTRVTLRARER